MGEYNEALPWIEKMIVENDEDTGHLDTIGSVYKGLKRYDESLKYYQKALDLGRSEAAYDIEEIKKLIGK